jgi:hypothetical protein
MVILYLVLLVGGVCLFMLSYIAQFRIAACLRREHPQQWRIIAEPETGKASAWRTWIRLQHALRSAALTALDDSRIDRWQRIWRVAPWLGWLCWFGAVAMRLLLR